MLASRADSLLSDKQLVRDIYTAAEQKAESAGDFIRLAEDVLRQLEDTDWARQLFSRAEQATDAGNFLYRLRASVARLLEDSQWVSRLRAKMAS